LDAIFASMLFPSAPVTLFCGFGYGAFAVAESEDKQKWYLAAGAAFGLACVTHEAAVIALVFYPVHVLASRRVRRGHLLALAGLVVALGIDPIVHGIMGDARARLDVLSHTATAQGTATDVAYSGLNAHWVMEPFVRLLTERTFGLFSWLVAPLAVYRLFRPSDPQDRHHDRFLSLVLISVFLWTEFGTLSLHRYAPLARLPRYLCPLTLPAMWLLAKTLCDLARPRSRRILLAVLTVSSLTCLVLDSGNQLRPYESIRSSLDSIHPAAVAVEKADEFPLRFAEGMRPAYSLSVLGAASPTIGAVVVKSEVNRVRLEGIRGVRQVAIVSRPRTAYQVVLSSPVVMAVLRRLRPPERFSEYEEKARSRDLWTIYSIP